MSNTKSIAILGYVTIVGLIFSFIALLLFLIALGSELTLPVITRDRPSGNGLYDHSNTLGWKLKPNLKLFLEKHHGEIDRSVVFLSTDSNGFRSTPKFIPEAKTGIMLGDSFTQGFYLSDRESIPWQVSELTQSNVINTGVGAYSSDQELIALEQTVNPNISWVALLLCANDLPLNLENKSWGLYKPQYEVNGSQVNFQKIIPPQGVNGKNAEGTAQQSDTLCCGNSWQSALQFSTEKFKKYLKLIPSPTKLASQIRQDYQWAFPSKGQYSYILPPSFYQNPRSMQREWDVTFQMIEKMAQISKDNGARFIVSYIPEIAQILNRDGLGNQYRPQTYFMRECARRNLECIDPTKQIEEHAMQSYIQDDGHLSAVGAQIMASEISKAIKTPNSITPPLTRTEQIPLIQLGQVIPFGKGQIGSEYLINVAGFSAEGWGWTYPETWGAWSEGSKAKIVMPLPKNYSSKSLSLQLNLRALLSPSHTKQRVTVLVDGQTTQEATLSKGDQNMIEIPLKYLAPKQEFVTLEFKLPDAVTPKAIGLGDDSRQLAIGIVSATFK
jgi:lysophospholipase L1-like esterase